MIDVFYCLWWSCSDVGWGQVDWDTKEREKAFAIRRRYYIDRFSLRSPKYKECVCVCIYINETEMFLIYIKYMNLYGGGVWKSTNFVYLAWF